MDIGAHLEMKLRCLATETALRGWELGCDPRLLKAREQMPEPSGYESPYYQVPEGYDIEEFLAYTNGELPEHPCCYVHTFERVLIRWEGATWWAWRHQTTGKIYL